MDNLQALPPTHLCIPNRLLVTATTSTFKIHPTRLSAFILMQPQRTLVGTPCFTSVVVWTPCPVRELLQPRFSRPRIHRQSCTFFFRIMAAKSPSISGVKRAGSGPQIVCRSVDESSYRYKVHWSPQIYHVFLFRGNIGIKLAFVHTLFYRRPATTLALAALGLECFLSSESLVIAHSGLALIA